MAERRNSDDHPDETGNEDRPEASGSEERPDESGSEDRPDESGADDRSDENGADRSDDENGNGEEERITGTSPSGADISKLEKFEPSEEAKRHEPSTEDAMGQDKRRQVVGHSYGPSAKTQIMFFVTVGVVIVVIVGGWLLLVGLFDNPPTNFRDSAPWSTTASDPALAAQQNAQPQNPADPCGEPGNPYPVPPQSPCATPNKSNAFQGNSAGQ